MLIGGDAERYRAARCQSCVLWPLEVTTFQEQRVEFMQIAIIACAGLFPEIRRRPLKMVVFRRSVATLALSSIASIEDGRIR